MKLIVHFELTCMSKIELHILFKKVSCQVATVPAGSRERSNALATLENIKRELASRAPSP